MNDLEADKIDANPSKEFFVEIITRDLKIADCLLDLVDNSLDHAVGEAEIDVMTILEKKHLSGLKRYRIDVEVSEQSIHVFDNCGGISRDEAKREVFRLGVTSHEATRHGLSVYGIGMKRAFFKLGTLVRVESSTRKESFVVVIDVDKWLAQTEWSFEFTDQGAPWKGTLPGTKIGIEKLRPEIKRLVAVPTFTQDLMARLASSYALFIIAGLDLRVNGKKVESTIPQIAADAGLKPARKKLRSGKVDILILAGVTPREDREPRGWYLFCNGRMVLEADRSALTAWGDGLPQWHTKYGHFVGYAYFRSDDVYSLPWTTTKQGIVFESRAYQEALSEMVLHARPVLNFLSNLYSEVEEQDVPGRQLLKTAKSVPITAIRAKDGSFEVKLPRRKDSEILVNVQFQVSKRNIERARQAIGTEGLSARKVAEHAFNYFLKHEAQ